MATAFPPAEGVAKNPSRAGRPGALPVAELIRYRPVFSVLHGLRCLGVAEEDRLARCIGMHRGKVTEILRRLHSRGLVDHDPEPFGGWSLTLRGRATEHQLTDLEVEESGVRDRLYHYYRSFMRLHNALLSVGHDWEMRPVGGTRMLNSHRDTEYDAEVLSRLVGIHMGTKWVYVELAGLLERFGIYEPRFSFALEHALAGENSYVADSVDSYQSVWLQLHEDLVATLGISRNDVRPAATV
jgi:DNA-binding MarR family transcriptional regulator